MSWLTNLVAKIAAKRVAATLDLQEGPMTDKKPWYKSKGVLTGLVTVLLGVYELVKLHLGPELGFNLPEIPGLVLTILGALGIYSRTSASTKIG